jgi:hypothetical protein
MTEFARKPSKLRRLWARFRYNFLPRLRLFFASTEKAEALVAEAERRAAFWTDVALTPVMPETEPRAIPLPDPAPAPAEAAGLVVRLGPQGYGPVYYNGVELRFVKEVIIYVRAGEPVTATVIMDAREGFDLQAAVCKVDFIKQKREVVPNA